MRKLFVLLIAVSLALIIAAGVFFFYLFPVKMRPAREYRAAVAQFESGEYVSAALQFEDMKGYADSAERAKAAWLAAGDAAFREGDLAQTRTYYLKGGADTQMFEKLDSEYYKQGVQAYADNKRVEAENCFSCISEGSAYLALLDQVRISCGERFLKDGDLESAEKVLRLCGDASRSEISGLWTDAGSERLTTYDLSGAAYCFAKAIAFAGDELRDTVSRRIDEEWVSAARRASAEGNSDLAEKLLARTGSGSEVRLAAVYTEAAAAEAEGRLAEALALYCSAAGYSDADARADALRPRLRSYFNAGGAGCFATLEDGKVGFEGDWGVYTAPDWDAVSIACGMSRFVLGVTKDGRVTFTGNDSDGCGAVDAWSGVTAVSAGRSHSVGLTSDGRVLACGADDAGQVSGVSSWEGITAVDCGARFTVGVRADGTLVACGDDSSGQCGVSGAHGAVSVACGAAHTVWLGSDGTAGAVGDDSFGQCGVSSWSGLAAVYAGANHTVGLLRDGTLIACGDNSHGECEVAGYTGVLSVACGDGFTLILTENGTRIRLGN